MLGTVVKTTLGSHVAGSTALSDLGLSSYLVNDAIERISRSDYTLLAARAVQACVHVHSPPGGRPLR